MGKGEGVQVLVKHLCVGGGFFCGPEMITAEGNQSHVLIRV